MGDARDGSDSVQCHTDLITCCTNANSVGPDRGDWYFPSGGRLGFVSGSDNIYEKREAQRIDLRRRNNADGPSGIYRCDIETNTVNGDGQETVYAGLYASGGEEGVK